MYVCIYTHIHNVCHLSCVHIIRNNKGTINQYTAICYSNNKQLRVSAVQGSHHRSICFRI
jgi:hypothetical protein